MTTQRCKKTMKHPMNLEVADWMLYDMPQAQVAAAALSQVAVDAMAATSLETAWEMAWTVMHLWAHVGASDSEPRNVMRDYIDAAFQVHADLFEYEVLPA